jgi:protein associated with RNAse G/E
MAVNIQEVTIYKHDHTGREVWQYSGKILARDENSVQLEAYFNRDDMDAGYVKFRRNDRFVEWFYSDKWYNIFEIHDVNDDRLKGWYCNMSRPAHIDTTTVRTDDLALDVWVSPIGQIQLLDEDEYANLPLEDSERTQVLAALDELRIMVAAQKGPFSAICGE